MALTASVKGRLNSAEGIDAASFLYQAVQAYDFYHIHHHNGCQLQIGGSDQWGNITAGIDLIDKLSPETKGTPAYFILHHLINATKAFGLTVPLLLSPTGEKLGKSAGNALFLSSELTHPFNLYQVLFIPPTRSAPSNRKVCVAHNGRTSGPIPPNIHPSPPSANLPDSV